MRHPKKSGVNLLRLIPFKSAGIHLLKEFMHPTEWDVINRYLEDPAAFQDKEVQRDIERLCVFRS